MMQWKYRVKIKHLFTKEEDWNTVQSTMKKIAKALENESCFSFFAEVKKFYKIPKDNEFITPIEYANKLISRMYDYADANQIWIE